MIDFIRFSFGFGYQVVNDRDSRFNRIQGGKSSIDSSAPTVKAVPKTEFNHIINSYGLEINGDMYP